MPAAVVESLDAEIGLRFHAGLHESRVGERYERRRSEVAALLEGGVYDPLPIHSSPPS